MPKDIECVFFPYQYVRLPQLLKRYASVEVQFFTCMLKLNFLFRMSFLFTLSATVHCMLYAVYSMIHAVYHIEYAVYRIQYNI
jgi:hypothetical protein